MTGQNLVDRAIARAAIRVAQRYGAHDYAQHYSQFTIHKFKDPKDRVARATRDGVSMDEVMREFDTLLEIKRFRGNVLLNAGINILWTLVGGTGATKYDNGNAYIGVGDSTSGAVATQTALQASSNKTYAAMNGGYPTYGASQLATWQSTFASGVANYPWNEIGIFNAAAGGGTMLDRAQQAMGTKASGTSWISTVQITLA